MEKYYKNFILCGDIDYYCLLCQEAFGDEIETDKHIRWEKHRKDKKIQECVPKYKKDFIYKINDNFYCEVCNVTIINVFEHVKEEHHQALKNNPTQQTQKLSVVKRKSDGTVKIKDKVVTKLQWHGISAGRCLLCDTNINRIYTHILSVNHMANLTQSSIKSTDNNYYRELKSEKFYCFTCFATFDNNYLQNHWIDNHNNKLKSEKESNTHDHSKLKNSKFDANNNVDNIMLKILVETHSKYYSIDVDKKNAKCLECNITVEATSKALYKHRNVHHPNSEEEFGISWFFDHGKRRSELAKYGKENYIKLNEGGSKGFCSLCNIFISAHINVAKQHVEGAYHTGHLELKGLIKDSKHEKPPSKVVPYKSFVEDMYGPFHIAEYDVIVLNNGICLETLSFALIRVFNDFRGFKGICFACDLTLNLVELHKHAKEKEHKNLMMQCKVLPMETKGDEELIRQIHPGLYHCGFCNKVFPFWENMAKHLKSFTHKVQKGKKKLLSIISAKLFLNPLKDIEDIEEYNNLRNLDGIN